MAGNVLVSHRARRLNDYAFAFTMTMFAPDGASESRDLPVLKSEAWLRLVKGDWTQNAEYVMRRESDDFFAAA